MSKFYNVRNGGDPSVVYGFQYANSYNVAPVTYTAIATSPGLQLTMSDINRYDFFNVAQTSAATDIITLPANAPIGTTVCFYSISAIKVRAGITGSGITVNGGTDAQGITTVINTFNRFIKTSATTWISTQFAVAGTVSAIAPS